MLLVCGPTWLTSRKIDGHLLRRQPLGERQVHLGGHDRHAADLLLEQALDAGDGPLRVVVRVREDDVVAVRAGLSSMALTNSGKNGLATSEMIRPKVRLRPEARPRTFGV